MKVNIPKPLLPGGTIGIIAPSGIPQNSDSFIQSLSLLKQKGYKLKFPRDLWPGYGYFADTDAKRAEELHRMMADSEVDAIICLRGGYGVLRILPLLDFEELQKYPKYIAGFSDISILSNVLLHKCGIPTIHGPVMTTLAHGSRDVFTSLEALLHGQVELMFGYGKRELLHGEADVSAPLVGGNLASLVSLVGTAYDFSWKDKVVFLEDIQEPLYKIDRMLTQLQLAGKFEEASAILLGDFTQEPNASSTDKQNYTEAVWQQVVDRIKHRNIPVIGGVTSGHIDENHALLLGATLKIKRRDVRIETMPLAAHNTY